MGRKQPQPERAAPNRSPAPNRAPISGYHRQRPHLHASRRLVAQRLARLEQRLHAVLCLGHATQAHEGLALQIEDVLLA